MSRWNAKCSQGRGQRGPSLHAITAVPIRSQVMLNRFLLQNHSKAAMTAAGKNNKKKESGDWEFCKPDTLFRLVFSWPRLTSPAVLETPVDYHLKGTALVRDREGLDQQQHGILQLLGEILLYNMLTITRNILSNCFCWRAIWASERSWKLKSSPLILALVWSLTQPAVYFKLLLETHKLFRDESSSIKTSIFLNSILAGI